MDEEIIKIRKDYHITFTTPEGLQHLLIFNHITTVKPGTDGLDIEVDLHETIYEMRNE